MSSKIQLRQLTRPKVGTSLPEGDLTGAQPQKYLYFSLIPSVGTKSIANVDREIEKVLGFTMFACNSIIYSRKTLVLVV